MPKTKKNALPVTRSENFSEWYQAVIDAAEMAEASGVRGCMIIKPWGYKIWERIQKRLDAEIQRTGHDNCYFPIFIPLELIEKEASHVEGFAKEMAVVTHHRLEVRDGKLVPAAPLESPLVVRPTSEAMITPAFKRWVQSYRDLPIKINQWANVVRWEMRPRLFLRTSEFLWQEGHTVHASAAEAQEETQTMLRVYADLAEKFMAIPVIPGTKSAGERFPGAVETHTIEAMMQDGRALQAGTSHYLGQNFANAADLTYLDQQGEWQTPHTTSWGASTRLIGALIMVHSDDDGLRLPPTLAPHQVVIVPIIRAGDDEAKILNACAQLAARLGEQTYEGETIRTHIDRRPDTPSNKRWAWVKKGAPLILEIGNRDIEGGQVSVHNRLAVGDRAVSRPTDEFVGTIGQTLKAIQSSIYEDARAYQKAMIRTDVSTFEEFKAHFKEQSGFVRAKWSGNPESEAELKEAGVTIRCLPYEQTGTQGVCVLTGAPATTDAIFAKAY